MHLFVHVSFMDFIDQVLHELLGIRAQQQASIFKDCLEESQASYFVFLFKVHSRSPSTLLTDCTSTPITKALSLQNFTFPFSLLPFPALPQRPFLWVIVIYSHRLSPSLSSHFEPLVGYWLSPNLTSHWLSRPGFGSLQIPPLSNLVKLAHQYWEHPQVFHSHPLLF